MKKRTGSGKGQNFERQIAKYLSRWITYGDRDDVFWRSSNSGGRATVRAATGSAGGLVSGDLCAVRPEGFPLLEVFVIECKFYKDLKLQDLPFDRKSVIPKAWNKVCKESVRESRRPMLILKQNNRPILLGLQYRMYREIRHQVRGTLDVMPPYLYSNRLQLALCEFDPVFEAFSPDMLTGLDREKN